MVVEKFVDGNVLYDHELNNKLSFHNNVMIGKSGTIYIHVPILSSGDTPKVRLYMFGKKAGGSTGVTNHGVPRHYHGQLQMYFCRGPSPYIISNWNDSGSAWNSSNEATNKFNWRFYGADSNGSGRVGDSTYNTTIPYNSVPEGVQIWIDGTNYTSTIGDPNSKGSTMYDSTNHDWGVDGTTEWNTGELDLSSVITWSPGDHYIELKETGGTGGTLIYTVLVN